MQLLRIFVPIVLMFLATSCVETTIVGTVLGGNVAVRNKTIIDTRKDIVIATKIGSKLTTKGLKLPFNSVDVTVNEGRVLLTGIVTSNEDVKKAKDLAWGTPGVKEVIDEIKIAKGDYLHRTAVAFDDYLISISAESRLFLNKSIRSSNYQITTVDKDVFVLGVARNESELSKTLNIIAKIRGVGRVINHAILLNDNRRHGRSFKKATFIEEDEEEVQIR